MKNEVEKQRVLDDLEMLMQNAHKCGYFGKSWKEDPEVQSLLMKFEHDLESVSR